MNVYFAVSPKTWVLAPNIDKLLKAANMDEFKVYTLEVANDTFPPLQEDFDPITIPAHWVATIYRNEHD